jgi:multidrug efflux pump subunit AcrA (membrane-fusion protein)
MRKQAREQALMKQAQARAALADAEEAAREAQEKAVVAQAAAVAANPWKRVVDPEGNEFFFNEKSLEIVWELPVGGSVPATEEVTRIALVTLKVWPTPFFYSASKNFFNCDFSYFLQALRDRLNTSSSSEVKDVDILSRSANLEQARLKLPTLRGWLSLCVDDRVGFAPKYVCVNDYTIYFGDARIECRGEEVSSEGLIQNLPLLSATMSADDEGNLVWSDPEESEPNTLKFRFTSGIEKEQWTQGLIEHKRHLDLMFEVNE